VSSLVYGSSSCYTCSGINFFADRQSLLRAASACKRLALCSSGSGFHEFAWKRHLLLLTLNSVLSSASFPAQRLNVVRLDAERFHAGANFQTCHLSMSSACANAKPIGIVDGNGHSGVTRSPTSTKTAALDQPSECGLLHFCLPLPDPATGCV